MCNSKNFRTAVVCFLANISNLALMMTSCCRLLVMSYSSLFSIDVYTLHILEKNDLDANIKGVEWEVFH
jgi:hypothetical protein